MKDRPSTFDNSFEVRDFVIFNKIVKSKCSFFDCLNNLMASFFMESICSFERVFFTSDPNPDFKNPESLFVGRGSPKFLRKKPSKRFPIPFSAADTVVLRTCSPSCSQKL